MEVLNISFDGTCGGKIYDYFDDYLLPVANVKTDVKNFGGKNE